jgi:TusA-related sulfurtransferase
MVQEKEVFDIRGACCLESAGLGRRLSELSPGGALEVIMDKSMREMAEKIVEQANCEITDVADEGNITRLKVRRKEAEASERKMENCMVCGSSLEYVTKAVEVVCNYCKKKEAAYVYCPKGHYVCEVCHGKGAFEAIKGIALSTDLKDPLAIAEIMMTHPSIPMLGCEHSYLTAAAFMAALKNHGKLGISNEQILEAMDRAGKISVSGFCALAGTCGIASGLAAAFGVITGAECSKDKETSITLHVMAAATEAIANEAGPCCCKTFTRTALGVGYNLAKLYLGVNLPIHYEKISCNYVKRHPHGCRASRCHYFPRKD